MKNKTFLVAGAGGFIGGHLVNRLIKLGANVIAADIKPIDIWFQKFDKAKNYQLDLKDLENCRRLVVNTDYVFNLACNMGGMGFIENNKAECMLSVLINTNLLIASKEYKVKKFFFSSSACIYNTNLQENTYIEGLRESDAYPAMPEDGYGWEKLFSERMCNHFYEDFGLNISVARFHNVYGPYGTYDGGREKAPAAICRKLIESKNNNTNKIEVWGDGNQTRSFLYIDDCIDGVINLFQTNYNKPLNIGSDEQVSINEMIEIIASFSDQKNVEKIYLLDKPKGVRGRSSNNEKCKKILGWSFKTSLKDGLYQTYNWIEENMTKNNLDSSKFRLSKIC